MSAKSSRIPLLAIGGILLIGLLAGAVLRLAHADSGSGSDTPSAPEDLPGNVVAVVSGAPASVATVTKSDFHHALSGVAAEEKMKRAPKPGDKKYDELKERALGERLDTAWLEGQAEEMGISVTARETSTELAKLKKQAFKSEAEYREFLVESRFSEADVRERVKAQILSTEIQRKITRRAGSSEKAQQDAFTDFVRNYEARWKARTVCAPAFAIERCSNGEESEAREGDSGTSFGEIPGAG